MNISKVLVSVALTFLGLAVTAGGIEGIVDALKDTPDTTEPEITEPAVEE